MKKVLKVLFITLISLLLLAGLTSIFISYFYSDSIRETLIERFEDETDNKYSLSISEIDLGFLTRSISIDSVKVEPNSNSKIRAISATSVSMNGIRWWSLWGQQVPNFSEIEIVTPRVEIVIPENYSFQANQFTSDSSETAALDSLNSFKFTLKNGSGVVLEEGSERELLSIDDISLEATQVNLQQLLSQSQFMFLEGLTVNGSGIKWSLHDKFYEMTIADFSFDKIDQSVTLSDLNFVPTLPKYEFSQQRGHQLDRIHLEVPEIELRGFELDSLGEKHVELDTLNIKGAWMEVFRNKQIPRPKDDPVKPLLHEIASATDFSFGLNRAFVTSSDIIYEEHKPPSDSTGSISFNDISASLYNFKTAAHPEFSDAVFEMDIEAMFMDVAPLSVEVKYPLYDRENNHTVRVELGSIDPNAVAGMLRNVAFVKLEDGFIEGLEAEINLNSETSSGEVLVLYRDLKVNFLDKDNPDDSGIKEDIKNFIANTFAINSNNTGDDAKTGEIDFDREKNKSIFAFWWKSLLSGIKDVIK